MLCEVTRPFDGAGQLRQIGDIVDVSDWRPQNVKVLMSTRYLREVLEEKAPRRKAKGGVDHGQEPTE